jgi:hypothetical protein
MGAATIATDHVLKSFRPVEHHSCRTNVDKTVNYPSSPLRRLPDEPRHSSEHHHSTASKHQSTPSLTTTTKLDRRHQQRIAMAVLPAGAGTGRKIRLR